MDIIEYNSVSDTENEISEEIHKYVPLLNISKVIKDHKALLLKTIYTTQISYIRVRDENLLIDLFSKSLRKFISREQVKEILSSCNISDSDKVVYSKFREIIKNISPSQKNYYNNYNNYTYNNNSIVKSPVKKYFGWWNKRIESRENSRQQDIFRFYNEKPKKYLDLGGGDGKITNAIGSYLKLKRGDVVCADTEWFDEERKENEPITYTKIFEENNRLPFLNNEFSLVTCFQSLHHMKNINNVISELYRITEPGGYIIIREHDCDSGFVKILIDIEHCIFECIMKDLSDNFSDKYYGNYKSKIEWSNLFERSGFVYCNKRYNFKMARNNHTKYYYAMYKKV